MCGDAPDAPDTRPQAEASKEIAEMNLEFSRESLDWAKERWGETQKLLAPVLNQQVEMANEQRALAREDRARWRERFLPAEDAFIEYATSYDTPQRQALEAGRAMAQVQQALDAQRQNAQQRLNAYGIDPSQTRSQAIDAMQRTQGAGMQAAAGNQARTRTEQVGAALLSDVSNMGRGLPGQAAASYSGALNAGNSAVGNQNATTGTFMPALGNAQGWNSQALAGINQSANIMNSGYANELAAYNASGGALGGLGQLGGMALGAYLGGGGTFGLEEGGEVVAGVAPVAALPGSTDTELRVLTPGEVVMSKEAVEAKGTEFFERINEKYAQGVPEGA